MFPTIVNHIIRFVAGGIVLAGMLGLAWILANLPFVVLGVLGILVFSYAIGTVLEGFLDG